jgi:crotonobetainyl-CoA:carnitine CoA-transferase CaiB-like acyl-CoA transferase
LWRQVAEAVGSPEIVDDPRFKTQLDRARNQDALAEHLERRFATRTAEEWLAEMDRRGVPCAPINSYPDILTDPHVQAMDLVRPLELPNGVKTRTVAFPVGITGYAFDVYREPPVLGAHTEEVAREWLEPRAEGRRKLG